MEVPQHVAPLAQSPCDRIDFLVRPGAQPDEEVVDLPNQAICSGLSFVASTARFGCSKTAVPADWTAQRQNRSNRTRRREITMRVVRGARAELAKEPVRTGTKHRAAAEQLQRALAGVTPRRGAAPRCRNISAPVAVPIPSGSPEGTFHDSTYCNRRHVCHRHRDHVGATSKCPVARSCSACPWAVWTPVGAATISLVTTELRVCGASGRIQVPTWRTSLASVRASSLSEVARPRSRGTAACRCVRRASIQVRDRRRVLPQTSGPVSLQLGAPVLMKGEEAAQRVRSCSPGRSKVDAVRSRRKLVAVLHMRRRK
jgi:hypothetical protein